MAHMDDKDNEPLRKYYDKITELHNSPPFKNNFKKELIDE
jgi:hypothetical protein